MDRRFTAFSILVLLTVLGMAVVEPALAQYGKIVGRVVDKENKEPLVAANVVIVGTTLGAATDVNGRYTVFNVPAGLISVRASYIGYQDVTVRDVRVTAGLVQEVNFEMPPVAIEAAPVEVVAQRPLIEKSATNAIRIVKGEELQKFAIRGTEVAYAAVVPGVVVQNNRVHVRGSRPDEVGYFLEGGNVRNITGEGSLVTVIPEALEEVLVQAGGYNAEYGLANAGMVQSNFQTGREKYHLLAQAETDNFADEGEKFLGTYSYGYSDYVVTFSGPLPRYEKVKLFLAGENRFIRDYTPTFWSGSPAFWSDGARLDTVFDTGTRGGKKGEAAVLSWKPGNIPGRLQNRYAFNGTSLFDFKPVQLRIAGTYSWQRTRSNGIPLMNLFTMDRLPLQDESSGFVNAKLTYFPKPATFLEANLSFLDQRSKSYDPNFDDDILFYSDSLKAAEKGWHYPRYAEVPRPYDFYGFPFNRPGTLLTGYGKSQLSYYGGSLGLTSAFRQHELKAGFNVERWTARNYSVGRLSSLLEAMRVAPDSARNVASQARLIRQQTSPTLNNYGFDEFGRKLDSGPDGPKHPVFFSAYVQDRMDFGDLIANLGIRYDYINMDTWTLSDPQRPQYDLSRYTIDVPDLQGKPQLLKSRKRSYVQPRLGFSFPVTDRTVFHLQYGKFVQPPALAVAYRGTAVATGIFLGGFYFTNPIAYDLRPTRTTQYEIGFTQQFTDFASFDLTAFYKDIKDQVQYDFIPTLPGSERLSPYEVYSNADFATTKGVELRLLLRRISRIQAQVNYTLSDSRGTNSFPTSAGGALNVTGIKPETVVPLLYDQRHRGSIIVDYRFGKGDGGPILQQLGLNMLFTFNSGHRFTKATGGIQQQGPDLGGILNDGDSRGRNPIEPVNASTTPWNFSIDVRLDKTVQVGGFAFNFYTYVQNLLNTKNVINVYYRTGNAADDGFLSNPELSELIVQGLGPRYVDLYKAINLENRQSTWRTNGFDLLGTPRQIRFGVRVEM